MCFPISTMVGMLSFNEAPKTGTATSLQYNSSDFHGCPMMSRGAGAHQKFAQAAFPMLRPCGLPAGEQHLVRWPPRCRQDGPGGQAGLRRRHGPGGRRLHRGGDGVCPCPGGSGDHSANQDAGVFHGILGTVAAFETNKSIYNTLYTIHTCFYILYIYIYRYIAFKLAHNLTKKMVGFLVKRVRLETVFRMGWIPGSGPHCDGQFIFSEDLMGTNLGRYPRHSITYVSWPKLGGLVDERKNNDTETGAELHLIID